MLGQSPMSQLDLRHAEYASLLATATTRSALPLHVARKRVSDAYYVLLKRAYVHARAARLQTSRATT